MEFDINYYRKTKSGYLEHHLIRCFENSNEATTLNSIKNLINDDEVKTISIHKY